MHSNDFIF